MTLWPVPPLLGWRLTGFVTLFLLWWLLTDIGGGLIPERALSRPSETADRIRVLAAQADFWEAVLRTSGVAALGLTLAFVLSFPVGLAVGSSRRLRLLTEFQIDFLRSIPVTALYPLFLLLLSIGFKSRVAMVFSAATFPILINTIYGVSHADPARSDVARAFGASRWQLFRTVTLYEALPYAVAGLRISISLALIVVVLAEMLMGATVGLGQLLWDGYSRNDAVTVTALILVLGVIGYLANVLFVTVQRRMMPWIPAGSP